MTDLLKWFFSRFFRIYFAFCLLAFAILVLLMNIPHALSFEPEALSPNHGVVSSWAPGEETTRFVIPKKLYQWNLPFSDSNDVLDSYMQFRGTRMLFLLRF